MQSLRPPVGQHVQAAGRARRPGAPSLGPRQSSLSCSAMRGRKKEEPAPEPAEEPAAPRRGRPRKSTTSATAAVAPPPPPLPPAAAAAEPAPAKRSRKTKAATASGDADDAAAAAPAPARRTRRSRAATGGDAAAAAPAAAATPAAAAAAAGALSASPSSTLDPSAFASVSHSSPPLPCLACGGPRAQLPAVAAVQRRAPRACRHKHTSHALSLPPGGLVRRRRCVFLRGPRRDGEPGAGCNRGRGAQPAAPGLQRPDALHGA